MTSILRRSEYLFFWLLWVFFYCYIVPWKYRTNLVKSH